MLDTQHRGFSETLSSATDPASHQTLSPWPATKLTETEEARVVGQLHGTYIVVQTPEGFELIDQHVAHERVLYEALLEQLGKGSAQSQKLLLPETIKLPPDQTQALRDHLTLLDTLGIELEAFGPDTFLLRAWPQPLADYHAKTGYRKALEQLCEAMEWEEDPNFETLAKVLVASLACEAAVVKNTLMPLDAMRHLVNTLKKAKDPFHCPHGRPIILKYGLPELERAFKRRGVIDNQYHRHAIRNDDHGVGFIT